MTQGPDPDDDADRVAEAERESAPETRPDATEPGESIEPAPDEAGPIVVVGDVGVQWSEAEAVGGAQAAAHEDVLQAGPAGDECLPEAASVDNAEESPRVPLSAEGGSSDDGSPGDEHEATPATAVETSPDEAAVGSASATEFSDLDRRFMAAAIRLSRTHLGLTSTNPSVGTLIVRDGLIVGRGVTARGGRPHAETQALAEAGEAARGATAYVTLEPCAHHGRTPPCAEALVVAGIARVVGAAADPDDRVSGRGYAILRAAGIEVVEGVLAAEAADLMAGYLMRSSRKRPEVTLKLALSADGMIGRRGAGQVAITGGIARAQVHLMRAEADAILVGIGTVEADNPELNVRLPGLEDRSPVRVVLDREARLPMMSKLALSARSLPLYVAVGPQASPVRRSSLEMLGVRFLATETHEGRIALPELLEDLAGKGISTVLVEGGAATARAFLDDAVVDRLALFCGPNSIGEDGIASPVTPDSVPDQFRLVREARFGVDRYLEWVRD